MGVANAASCLSDEWAIFNNPAGLAKSEYTSAAFTYEAHPSLSSFNRIAATIALPIRSSTAAIGVYKFGDDLYNEQIISAAFANTLGLASLGLKLNYLQYYAEGFG